MANYQLGKDGFVTFNAGTICATRWEYSSTEEGGDSIDVTTFCDDEPVSVVTAGTVAETISFTTLECTSLKVGDEGAVAVGIDSGTCYSFDNGRVTDIQSSAEVAGTVETTVTITKFAPNTP
jgi:hypothetical protein